MTIMEKISFPITEKDLSETTLRGTLLEADYVSANRLLDVVNEIDSKIQDVEVDYDILYNIIVNNLFETE